MNRSWILPIVATLAAVAYWQRLTFDSQVISILLKMTPALAMALEVAFRRGTRGWAIVAALVLHAIGDGLLNMGPQYLLAGMGMFFLGHLGYISAFFPFRYRWEELPRHRLVGIVALGTVASAITLYIWPHLSGVLAIASPIYAVALTAMAVVALLGRWRGPLVVVGALLFVLSDVVLGLELFVNQRTLAPIIWPTYATAQIMMPIGYLRTTASHDAR
jgi:uncharacterized membrane protein YhhN